jgi:hypothetical protein
MEPIEGTNLRRCPRCRGKMLPAPDVGDSVCFTCGHVAYPELPANLDLDRQRPTSHAGRSLH